MIKRIITGTILIVFTLFTIIFAPLNLFITISAILTLFGAFEWSILSEIKNRIIYIAIIAFLMLGALFTPKLPILIIAFLWWCVATFLIITYPKTSNLWSKGFLKRAFIGVLVLIPSWIAIIYVREKFGIGILLFMLLLVWSADIGAYFIGKLYGKHYLMQKVSPKKTIEGLFGGLLLSLIVTIIACFIFKTGLIHSYVLITLSIITVLFSVIGDLLESMLKRQIGIKDIGNYLPGHGGFLDRIDSLTAAAPIFALGLYIIY